MIQSLLLLACVSSIVGAGIDNPLFTARPVDYQYKIARTGTPAHALPSLSLKASLGETTCGSFTVTAKSAIAGLSAALTDFTNSGTGHSLSRDSLSLRTVEFVWVDAAHTQQVPVRLRPIASLGLPSGENRQFWMTARSSAPLDTGRFSGGVIVTGDAIACTLAVTFDVYPFRLRDSTDHSFGAFMGTLRTVNQATANDMKAHGIDGVQYFLGYGPGEEWNSDVWPGIYYSDSSVQITNVGGSPHVEFKCMDSLLKFIRNAGMRGPVVPSFGNDNRSYVESQLCRAFPQFHLDTGVTEGNKTAVIGPVGDTAFDALYLSVVRQFKEKIESYGYEMVLLIYDEPSERLQTPFAYRYLKVHKAFPTLRTYGSMAGDFGYVSAVANYAEIIATGFSLSTARSDATRLNKALWIENFPMDCDPGFARGSFGLQYWNYRPQAAFFWAYNYYRSDPYVEYDGNMPEYRNAVVYPACCASLWQPVGTINWEAIREARNDWAYAVTALYLLNRDSGAAAAAIRPKFPGLMNRVGDLYGSCGASGYSVLDSVRLVLAQWILEMNREAPGVIGIEDGPPLSPGASWVQLQISPNPFNSAASISCRLTVPSDIQMDVIDVRGRKVSSLYDGRMAGGEHTLVFRPPAVSSGLYWCRLKAGKRVLIKPLIFLD